VSPLAILGRSKEILKQILRIAHPRIEKGDKGTVIQEAV
jgi:hypothetical protein